MSRGVMFKVSAPARSSNTTVQPTAMAASDPAETVTAFRAVKATALRRTKARP
jgi:hypothetical protein